MRLENEPADEVKKAIRQIIGKHLDLAQYRAFVFGSRVTGTGGQFSDIDIGIEGISAVPAEAMTAIKEEMEALPYLYVIDVVDFSRASDQFKQVAEVSREYL